MLELARRMLSSRIRDAHFLRRDHEKSKEFYHLLESMLTGPKGLSCWRICQRFQEQIHDAHDNLPLSMLTCHRPRNAHQPLHSFEASTHFSVSNRKYNR